MSQTCKSPSCFFESKQKTNSVGEERENKSYKIPETELEANLLQNKKNYGKWKLFTKSKLHYFPKILGAEKPIKGHKHQGEKRELHRVFLVYFLLYNSFVLPPHGRLNLFG